MNFHDFLLSINLHKSILFLCVIFTFKKKNKKKKTHWNVQNVCICERLGQHDNMADVFGPRYFNKSRLVDTVVNCL